MDELKAAQKQKLNILEQIRALGDMRRGSVTEQFFERKRSDGAITRCGPYHLYTYKQDGQTISRRLPDAAGAVQYRAQIEQFRRFEELSAQLVEISQRICDLLQQTHEQAAFSPEKKRRRSPSNKTGR